MNRAEQVIVALDTNGAEARALAQSLQGKAHWLKVGMTLYYSEGPRIVEELKSMGYKIFVDLKLHDIPHQVQGAAQAVAQAGADMLTVHASGGKAMMQAACRGAEQGAADAGKKGALRPICLAITVLTSLDDDALATVGVLRGAEQQVSLLAALAAEAGMDGVVCSPQEAAAIRQEREGGFTIVTPGVRPAGSELADQARVATPERALSAGANYLVIGRPITQAARPALAFANILKEMK